jgi:hypothetical protein
MRTNQEALHVFDDKAGHRGAPKVLHTYESACTCITRTEMRNYIFLASRLTTQAMDVLEMTWKEDWIRVSNLKIRSKSLSKLENYSLYGYKIESWQVTPL